MFRPQNLNVVLSEVASFPKHYFPENLVVRHDNSLLVTIFDHGELWYLPPSDDAAPVQPRLLHKFSDQPPLNLVEVEADLFYLHTSNVWTTRDSSLHRLDLRDWSPGEEIHPLRVMDSFPASGGLNGSCLIAPNVILIADSVAGLIWRVDVAPGGLSAKARVWLAHGSMAFEPDGIMPNQPGINGIRYAEKTAFVYYTSTVQRLFMRVKVDPNTLEPGGVPEFVSGGRMADDFLIDEAAGLAYLTTHLQHTIDVVSLTPTENRDATHHVVAGEAFSDQLVGPSSAMWGRRPGERGRVAYVTTDGGAKKPPPDGVVRPARVMRMELV